MMEDVQRDLANCLALALRLVGVLLVGICGEAFAQDKGTLPEIEVRPPTIEAKETAEPTNEAPVPAPVDAELAPANPTDSQEASPLDNPVTEPLPLGPSFGQSGSQPVGGNHFSAPAAQETQSPFANSSLAGPFGTDLGTNDRFSENLGVLRGGLSVFDSPAAVSIRSRSEIERRQAPDIFHALQNEVGVLMQATAAGQASPFVRGLTGQQVLILIDGIRLNNSFFRRGPNQYFNLIDPGSIDHIEVLRGQGSVLWGSDAIGGAINVVTRGADMQRGMAPNGYASRSFTQYFNTANSGSYSRMNAEGWVGRKGVFGGVSFQNVHDLDTGFEEFSRQPGTNYQGYSGDLKFNYLLNSSSMLTFSAQHYELENVPRSDRFPGFPLDRNNSNSLGGARFFDPQQRDLLYVRYQTLAPQIGFFDAVTATASYHRQREVQERGVPTTRFQETDVRTTGLQAVASKDGGDYGKLTTGIDYYYDDIASDFGGAASGPIVPDDAWYSRVGWFINWDVELTDRLIATMGTRYESIETEGTPVIASIPTPVQAEYDDWVSQIGLTYRCTDHVNVFGSISQGFRAPNLDDLMANNPNVLQAAQSVPSLGLVPENSLNYEVGFKTRGNRLRTQFSAFHLDINDNIVSITAAADTFASANEDSHVNGVEFNGDFLLTPTWALYGNFWYTYGINDETGAPLSRIPPTQGILGLRYQDPANTRFFDVYTWASRRQDRLDAVRDFRDERISVGGTPGFATLNIRMGRQLTRDSNISLSLENVTDKDYLVHGSGLIGTGATARIGMTLGF